MRKILILCTVVFVSLVASAQTLSVTQSGSGNTATITVTSSGQFSLTWDAADNWGLDGWYDLINDPTLTTNLAAPVYSVNGSSQPCAEESGMVNYVLYSENDEKLFMKMVSGGCTYSSATRTMTIITNDPNLVVLESTQIPVAPSSLSADLTSTVRYYIYPNGKIYVHFVLKAVSAHNFSTCGTGSTSPCDEFTMMLGLPDSLQTGTLPPDTQTVGWVRASTTQNPYNFVNGAENYVYEYWPSSSGAYGYGSSMTPKASIMIVPSPSNALAPDGQLQHSWACGTGCGVVRWGYHKSLSTTLAAGQTMTWDWLLQLGTQGSSVLPNMTVAPPTNCSTCTTIANAYRSNPVPPALLTGMTPDSYTLPSGWTLLTKDNFEGSSCPGAWFCSGNYTGTQAHTGTKALHMTYNGNGSLTWNTRLPVGTRSVYASWYEYLSTPFRMNDEMFLARFHWDTGNGQPDTREAILDYFQDSTLTYNSTDATLLWNLQGFPYYQNRLPSNSRTDTTNFNILTGAFEQWELYMKFSSISGTISAGNVTLDATAHTYTRTTGSWISDGVQVGDSLHFGQYDPATGLCKSGVTCFANSWNNGWGAQGGGGDSYFVTNVTATVVTVTPDCCNSTTTQSVTGISYQIDHGDGAYALYENGNLVAYQNNMISPGKDDFSTSNTTFSIGESYTKNIWHAAVSGSCETHPPFTGTCSSTMTGCDYDNLENVNSVNVRGWNGAGLTQSSPTFSTFDTHIDCDATWGGPMPTPPVFDRYVDDVIVLTKSGISNFFPINRSFGSKISVRGGGKIIIR